MAWPDSEPLLPPADHALATLFRISYKKLVAAHAAEIERLFVACKDIGFCYLDVQNGPILKNVDEQFAIAEEFSALDAETKRAYPLGLGKAGVKLYATG